MIAATDELPLCDAEIFQSGKCVAMISGGSARFIDRFVKEVAESSGEKVDWHCVGGVGRVLTLASDVAKVQEAIERLKLTIRLVI